MQAFLEDPAMSPDTSCVDDVLRADFITDVFVNPGIYQLVRQFQYPPPAVKLLGLGLVFLLIISAIVVWPVSWLIRRVFRNRSVASRNGRAARGLAWITAVIVIGFMAGLALAIQSASSENYFLPAIGVMPSARNLFFVPWLIAILTIGMAMFCVLAWKQRWWNAAHRVHYSLVAVACAGFLVWVGNLGLMSS
jgi:hypothetical protein